MRLVAEVDVAALRALSPAARAALTPELERVVGAATERLRESIRGQVSAAGLGTLARTWRSRVFGNRTSAPLSPAGFVWTRAPKAMRAFAEGATIRAKNAKYLAWPTGFNAIGGRRNAGRRGGLRATPQQMIAGGAFMIPFASRRGYLWCLPVRQASAVSRGGTGRRRRGRTLVFAGNLNVEVATGRGGGPGKAKRSRIVADLLRQGFVPMFFLVRQVTLAKRLDIPPLVQAAGRQMLAELPDAVGRASRRFAAAASRGAPPAPPSTR